MTAPQTTLLDELDARQNEVLQQLDALNHRIDVVLDAWTADAAETIQNPVDA